MNEDRSQDNNQSSQQRRFALLGASRGLGWATYQALSKKYPTAEFMLVSRKISHRKNEINSCTQVFDYDFSKELSSDFVDKLADFNPTHIVYFAAGGPYGNFHEKKWSDHQWALQVTFLFPAQLLHHFMRISVPSLKQFVLVGSAIAENQPDPGAASYCAAKHALKGLITTLQKENKSPFNCKFKIELFSPGYIETDMLPPQSWPRQQGLAESAENVAQQLINLV